MSTLRRISVALLVFVALGGCPKLTRNPNQGLTPPLVRETFESGDISTSFFYCWRPENKFTVVDDHSRNGAKSLKLTIHKLPLFAHLDLPEELKAATAAKSCLQALTETEGRKYLGDDAERAEVWESKDESPPFTEDFFYGFSMLIPRASAPLGDFNRMVVGQWKMRRRQTRPPDTPFDSPILSIRVTGGFFHVMLDVKAVSKEGTEILPPPDCKVLLAFTAEIPPNEDAPLDRNITPRCESRLNYNLNQGQPAPIDTLTIDRPAYLPNPWSADGTAFWVDLVFHIKGGENGVVELWANKILIAKATGWIGYEGIDDHRSVQYFKIGPYRDPAGYDTVIYLDNLARGHSFADVDPSREP